MRVRIIRGKGGEGSGNFGHAGRPGEVGGSSSSGKTPQEMTLQEFREWSSQRPPKGIAGLADFRMGPNPNAGLIAHEWAHTSKEFLAVDGSELVDALEKDKQTNDWWSDSMSATEALASTYGWLHGGNLSEARMSPEILKIAQRLPTPPKTIEELWTRIRK
jgi:hypothetical protein